MNRYRKLMRREALFWRFFIKNNLPNSAIDNWVEQSAAQHSLQMARIWRDIANKEKTNT